MKRYVEVRGVHLGVLPQWRWRPFVSSTRCHSRWLQWGCFEFAIERWAHVWTCTWCGQETIEGAQVPATSCCVESVRNFNMLGIRSGWWRRA